MVTLLKENLKHISHVLYHQNKRTVCIGWHCPTVCMIILKNKTFFVPFTIFVQSTEILVGCWMTFCLYWVPGDILQCHLVLFSWTKSWYNSFSNILIHMMFLTKPMEQKKTYLPHIFHVIFSQSCTDTNPRCARIYQTFGLLTKQLVTHVQMFSIC